MQKPLLPLLYDTNKIISRGKLLETKIMDTQKNEKSEMMLKNINKFVEYSCQLEDKREEILIRQSGLMIIAIAVMSTLILKSGSIEFSFLNCCSEIFLVMSLFCALLTSWKYKYINFPYSWEFYDYVEENKKYFQDQFQFDWHFQNCLTIVEKSKKAINDKRVRFLNFSCICLFVSVVLYFISFDIIYAIHLIRIPR